MSTPGYVELPRFLLQTLNQLYDIERKLAMHGDAAGIARNVERSIELRFLRKITHRCPFGCPRFPVIFFVDAPHDFEEC